MATLRVILVEPENAINVGSIARAMKNFGFRKLYLVNPMFESFDRAYAAAMRARDVLEGARVVTSLEEAFEGAHVVVGTTAKPGPPGSILRQVVPLRQYVQSLRWDAEYALVFGRESTGLTNEELARCDVLITIPASEEYPTLNLANAVAVVLYEFRMAMGAGGMDVRPPERKTVEIMLKYLDDIIDRVDLPEHKRRRLRLMARRVIGRVFPCGLTEEEILYALGAVRRIRDAMVGD